MTYFTKGAVPDDEGITDMAQTGGAFTVATGEQDGCSSSHDLKMGMWYEISRTIQLGAIG